MYYGYVTYPKVECVTIHKVDGEWGIFCNFAATPIATHLVVFWDGKSNGTRHMIEIAKAKGIPVWGLKYPHTETTEFISLVRW